MEKKCPKCATCKPTTEFHKCKRYKDGLASWCRACCKAHKTTLYLANPEKEQARVKAWYEAKGAEMRRGRVEAKKALLPPKDTTIKFCPNCQQSKPKSDFSKCSRRYDGLQGTCRQCKSMGHKARFLKLAALPKETPESKPCADCGITKPATDYYKSKSAKDGLSRACKECGAVRAKDWSKRMPLKSVLNKRGHCARRRAIQKEAAIGEVDYYTIAVRDNFTCYLCGHFSPVGEIFHFDHIIPLSKGGAHSNENIKVACAPCNLKKGAQLPPLLVGASGE